MKNKEIERKFFVSEENLPQIDHLSYMDMTQGYSAELGGKYIYRLRQVLHYTYNKVMVGEEYFQTIKGWGSKIRDEYEINIMMQQFHTLWPVCQDTVLHKHRYELTRLVGQGKEHYYLDKYLHDLTGLYTVEVEFNTIEECDAFVPPDWFGPELTEDNRFSNYRLAVNGLKDIIDRGFKWHCIDCGFDFSRKVPHKCVDDVKNNTPKFILAPCAYDDSKEPWNLRK